MRTLYESAQMNTSEGEYRNAIVLTADHGGLGEEAEALPYTVEQRDIEDGRCWNSTPVRAFARLDEARAFADHE